VNASEQDQLLLNAYVDGELDAIDAASFERRLGAEPALTAQVEARRALRNALRSDLGEDVPSPDLRRRIMTKLSRRGPGEWLSWRMAASFLIGAALAGTMSVGLLNDRPGEDVAHAVVSAHIRALMAPQPTDVVSSDHHTVKPWFNGKLAFAPTVADLSAQGFPLVGARIDVLGLEPVASLVYSHGKHFISLTEMPNARGTPASVESYFEHGYLAITWSDGGIAYWAVSDAAAGELESFVKLFQTAAAGS
jgi:anti-sigma factor RsiW